jgi:hypothetical protein
VVVVAIRRWLVKIQAKQMHSDDPYVDDFYAHTLVRRRAAAMRAAAAARGVMVPAGQGAPPVLAHGPMPMGKHRREKVEQARAESKPYNPVQFDKTLGSIKGTSIRAPKPLIEMPKIPPDVHADHTGGDGDAQSRELIERARRRKALISIEHAYREMILAEDRAVKLEQPGMSVRARQQIEDERRKHLVTALGYFQVCVETCARGGWQRSMSTRAVATCDLCDDCLLLAPRRCISPVCTWLLLSWSMLATASVPNPSTTSLDASNPSATSLDASNPSTTALDASRPRFLPALS